jgi:phage repressor protein C with HTH and peptisase S24 domain
MTEPSFRLALARRGANYATPTDAARAFGWTVSTYLAHENGTRGITRQAAMKYARAFHTSAAWILTGEDSNEPTSYTVPLVGYVGAGAEIRLFDGDQSSEYLDDVPMPPEADEHTVAVIVQGDSMYPRYHEKELIYYRRRETPVEPQALFGRDVVARLADGRTFVKVLRRGSQPDLFTLESYNAPPLEDVTLEWVVPVEWVKRS